MADDQKSAQGTVLRLQGGAWHPAADQVCCINQHIKMDGYSTNRRDNNGQHDAFSMGHHYHHHHHQ